MINQHIKQHLEEFQKEETIEFNRLDWDNVLISPLTTEELNNQSQKEKSSRCKQNKCTITTTCNSKHNTTNHHHI